jgi:hypothetical protein
VDKGLEPAAGRKLHASTAFLEFGCSWGRYARMFWKDVSPQGIRRVSSDSSRLVECWRCRERSRSPTRKKGQIVMTELRWSLACGVAIYVLAICGLAIFQRRLQYFPDRRLVDPAQAGMSGVEDLRLTIVDGETLVAWVVPAKDGHPLILYFHGNGGALVDRIPRFSRAYGERIRASCYILSRLWRLDWLADTKGPDG